MSWQFHVIGTKGSLSIMSNPWFPGNRSTIHLTLYDRFQPNFPSPREEIMGYYSDKPLRSYTIDVLGQCVLIKGLTGNAVSLDHTLGNIKILEEWREKVAAKQPQLEKPLHQSSLTNTSATQFKQKQPEEKDQGKKLFVPSRRNGNSNN
jgi:hypothetical protein